MKPCTQILPSRMPNHVLSKDVNKRYVKWKTVSTRLNLELRNVGNQRKLRTGEVVFPREEGLNKLGASIHCSLLSECGCNLRHGLKFLSM